MKRKWFICALSATLIVLASLSVLTIPIRAQETIFTETFDNRELPGWERTPNAIVAEGILHIEGTGFAFWPGKVNSANITLKLRLEGDGYIEVHYQQSDTSAYILRLTGSEIAIYREQEGIANPLNATDVGLPQPEWVEVTITLQDKEHLMVVAAEHQLEAFDPDPLPPGGLSLHAFGDAVAEFDDLTITHSGEVKPIIEDTPEREPIEPSAEPQATPETLPLGQLTWVRTGGPPGGLGYDIRYNFDDPNIWYVTDTNAGVNISGDNGLTWQPSNNGIETVSGAAGDAYPIFSLTVDPHNPQILWVGTDKSGHIYKSTDGGHTWVKKTNGVVITYDGLSFRGFTVDPRTSDIVYAMAETFYVGNNVWGDRVGGAIYKTEDSGENWKLIWDEGIPSSLARYMWIDPRDPEVLYVSTGIFDRGAIGEGDPETDPYPFGGLGILKSTDGGETWRVLNEANGLEHLYIGSLYMHPQDPDVLLAASGHLATDFVTEHYREQGHSPQGIYRTEDGGETWTKTLSPSSGFFGEVFSSVEICTSDPTIAYAGSELAIYRSEDGGRTWEQMTTSLGSWGPPGVRAGFPIDMQCDPRDTNRIFVNNYSGGNFLSEDGGRTWENASSGYTGAQIIDVAVDPFNPARIFAAGRSGAWYSDDSGATWHGLHNPGDTTALAGGEWGAAAFDPVTPNHILVAGGEGILEWLPDAEPIWQRHMLPDTYSSETAAMEFAPSDPSIVYAGAANHNTMVLLEVLEPSKGFMVSEDGGSTWENIAGVEFSEVPVMDLSIHPTDPQTVYAATAIGLFKTTDGGQNWSHLSSLSEQNSVRTVGVNPTDPNRVLAGIEMTGLYLSTDGGATWGQVAAGLEPNANHRDIIFDPTDANIVYVSDLSSGVYRSEDAGETWLRITEGLDTRSVTGLSISSDGQHLYAATAGGGVYPLDFNGQPPVSTGLTLFTDTPTVSPSQAVEQTSEAGSVPEEEPAPDATRTFPCFSGAIPIMLMSLAWAVRRKKRM